MNQINGQTEHAMKPNVNKFGIPADKYDKSCGAQAELNEWIKTNAARAIQRSPIPRSKKYGNAKTS